MRRFFGRYSLSILLIGTTLFLFAFLPSAGRAQDDVATEEASTPVIPEEAPTEFPTSEPPTDTPTETLVPTDLPTVTPTELPSITPTFEPTATDVPVEPTVAFSTLEATTEPTLLPPPEPALTLLHSETFDNGDLSHWRVSEGWAVVPSETGQALALNAPLGALQFHQTSLTNVAVQTRVLTVDGTTQLLVRQSADGSYSVSLSPDGQVILTRAGISVATANVEASAEGQWRTLRLSAMENVVRVSVDGNSAITYVDPMPLPVGAVSAAGALPQGVESAPAPFLLLDDVTIWVAEDEIVPSLTSTFLPTLPSTLVLTDVPTLVPAMTEPTQERVILIPDVATMTPSLEPTVLIETTPTVEATVEVTLEVETTQDTQASPQRQSAFGADGVAVGPVPPALSAPSDSAVLTTTRPAFSWAAAPGAVRYRLDIAQDAEFESLINTDIEVTTRTYTLTSAQALAQGQYWWRVQAGDSASAFGGESIARTFTIFAGTAPANAALLSDTTPTLTWSAISGATGYTVQIDDDAAFTSLVRSVDVGAVTTYTLPAAQALPQGRYYWRVLRRLPTPETPVSIAFRTFTIFIGTAPANGTFTTDTTPTFTWVAQSGVTGYRLDVATDAAFTAMVQGYPRDVGNVTTFTPGSGFPISQGDTYYWRVVRRLPAVEVPGAAAYRTVFVVNAAPGAPTLQSPANNAALNDATPLLAWNANASVPAGVELRRYEVQLATNSGFTSGVQTFQTADAQTLSLSPQNNLTQGLKYWRVRAWYGDPDMPKAGGWSAARTFRIDTAAPPVPSIIAPSNGAVTTNTKPTFSWNTVTGAARYELRYRTQTSDWQVVVRTTASWVPTSPLLYAAYQWQVRALDAAGNASLWSGTNETSRNLTINSASTAAPVLNRYPDDVELAWTPISWATMYQVQVATNTAFTGTLTYSNNTIPAGGLVTVIDGLGDGTYYWRVRARKADGVTWGGWSSVGTFTVEAE